MRGWCGVLCALCTSTLCNRQSCLVSVTQPPWAHQVVHSLQLADTLLSRLIEFWSWILDGVPSVWHIWELDLQGLRKDEAPGARYDCLQGQDGGKVVIPASSAERFPGLSFSRRGRRSGWEGWAGMALSRWGWGGCSLSWRLFLAASSVKQIHPLHHHVFCAPDSAHCGGFCLSLQE